MFHLNRSNSSLSRRALLVLICAIGAVGIGTQAGAAAQTFDQPTFDKLQLQGKPVLVMVHASWCPTCKAQEPLISELLQQPENKSLTALRVDFDAQKPVVHHFKVSQQSTLIVFKGGKEVGRSTGDTSKAGIAALLKKAV
jgi:thiol-disulfide isomerase/thioredoxin